MPEDASNRKAPALFIFSFAAPSPADVYLAAASIAISQFQTAASDLAGLPADTIAESTHWHRVGIVAVWLQDGTCGPAFRPREILSTTSLAQAGPRHGTGIGTGDRHSRCWRRE